MLQSLLLTGLGGLLAIAGTIAGHAWQARENRRIRLEGYRREDRYRLYNDRLQAYRELHLAVGKARKALAGYSNESRDPDPSDRVMELRNEFWSAYTLVWLIGGMEVVRASTRIFNTVDAVVAGNEKFDSSRWGELVRSYISAARADLFHATEADK